MSITLLERLRDHIDAANLLDGYQVKFYRWSDQDLNGTGQLILFRMAGTGGPSAHVIQSNDVSIQMLCDPDQVRAGDNRMLAILRYLRNDFETNGVFNIWPVSGYSGPNYLENNRATFQLVVRCMTVDH